MKLIILMKLTPAEITIQKNCNYFKTKRNFTTLFFWKKKNNRIRPKKNSISELVLTLCLLLAMILLGNFRLTVSCQVDLMTMTNQLNIKRTSSIPSSSIAPNTNSIKRNVVFRLCQNNELHVPCRE